MSVRQRKAASGEGSFARDGNTSSSISETQGASSDDTSASRSGAASSSSTRSMLMSTLPQWIFILSLIFGGCCSNAYYLELSTRALPQCGTLLTFLHFFFTSLQVLPAQLKVIRISMPLFKNASVPIIVLKRNEVPMIRWAVQVSLYFATSLLNNTAFAYHVPMPVHIIFRSGGLVVNMIVGWLLKGRKYSALQIFSVLLVTFGVILSTLATTPETSSSSSTSSTSKSLAASLSSSYFTGILLLTCALFISSLMGLWQEMTFAAHGSQHWREMLFYSHALSLPLFYFKRAQLNREWTGAMSTPMLWIGWGLPSADALAFPSSSKNLLQHAVKSSPAPALSGGMSLDSVVEQSSSFARLVAPGGTFNLRSLPVFSILPSPISPIGGGTGPGQSLGLLIPSIFPPLTLNILTQLLCINGVNRLTSQVSSLTVTLVLVVRKAVSLAFSLLLFGSAAGGDKGAKGTLQLGAGATAVLLGTVAYALGSSGSSKVAKDKRPSTEARVKPKTS
ncbi:udp-n-acetylglucosamine transporter [Ceraceosorus bombacis]|uniref:Udp-n-acetylglucosamine transporter n=1 Tax=Ceraceosorus bombacis TaxID=401625 RepID=A0A0P1BD92_9BASI|nr:udp-n-acetylglucosamine transporter [Ceraceosorus bombacis]